MSATAELSDTELVARSLADDREAFGQIVSRYQSLICSLTYSATGSLSASEDLAEQTFLTAWQRLRQLREPAKLRAWLCGIARGLISNAVRRQGHEPVHAAAPLDAVHDFPAFEPTPAERVITQEEEAILWRSLERIPDDYREPLVLFCRRHQSVAQVAQALDLSEDAVKQRLSRGRRLLHEEVLSFVEGPLERTNPGKAFTLGVLAALPLFAASASAATVGITTPQGSAGTKGAGAIAKTLLMTTHTKIVIAVVVIAAAIAPVIVQRQRTATRSPETRMKMIAETRMRMIAQAMKHPEAIKQRAIVTFDLIRQADYGRDWLSNDNWHEFLRGDNYCVDHDKPGWAQWICRNFKTNPIASVELGEVFQDHKGRPTVPYKLIREDGTMLQGNLPFYWEDRMQRWEGIEGLDWHLGRGRSGSTAR